MVSYGMVGRLAKHKHSQSSHVGALLLPLHSLRGSHTDVRLLLAPLITRPRHADVQGSVHFATPGAPLPHVRWA